MDENTNDTQDVDVSEDELSEEPTSPETDWEAEAKKARGIAQRALTKLKKLGDKKPEPAKPAEPAETAPKTGELDETALDYLDLKGINEDEDIKIIQDVVRKTGQTVRQALKDDYVQSKLKSNKEARDVKAALPGNTKRGGSGANDSFEAALAKYEKTKELPTDFDLRIKVIDASSKKNDVSTPPWRR